MPEVATDTTEMTCVTLTSPAIVRYRKRLHRWIVRRLRNPDVADDVTQEVFLRLCRVEGAAYVHDPLGYLFGIAAHVISARFVSEHRNPISFDSDEVGRAEEHVENTFEDQLDLQLRLEKALAQLPSRHRTVLLLCKAAGMTYAEAARESGLSVHTVEKYLVRARAQLTALMCDR